MTARYLEVTYSRGNALAAYLHLPRLPGVRAVRTGSPWAGAFYNAPG